MEFPRVLVISPTSIGTKTATGIAMASFFRDWPRDALAQIYSERHGDFDLTVCDNYFSLESPLEKLRSIPLIGKSLCFFFGNNGILGEYIPLKPMLSWINRFQPDLLYYRVVDRPTFYWWLPLKLSRILEIPLVAHIMDDWPARFESESSLSYNLFFRPRLQRGLSELFSSSAVNLSISEEMSKAFKLRYGVDFIPIHNSIDITRWRGLQNYYGSFDNNQHFRIVYSGSLAADMQLQSLKDIAEVVSGLIKKGVNISLAINSAPWWLSVFRKHFMNIPAVRFSTFAPQTEYPRILAEADLLILPVNFDKRSFRYVRYSMANKVPEYMASGTPVLVYGPLGTTTVEYASSAGWAYVVPKRSKKQLERAIMDLRSSRQKRVTMAKRAKKLAFLNHNASRVRPRFAELLRNAINLDRGK